MNNSIWGKKIGYTVAAVCKQMVFCNYSVEDFAVVLSTRQIKTHDDAQVLCKLCSEHHWNNFVTVEQSHELLDKYGSFSSPQSIEKRREFQEENLKKAQEIFWALWESGKLIQITSLPHGLLTGFMEGHGVYNSVLEFRKKLNNLIENKYCCKDDTTYEDLLLKEVCTYLNIHPFSQRV